MAKKINSPIKFSQVLRFIPTIVGICIIGSFIYYSPNQAKKLYSAFVNRFTDQNTKKTVAPDAGYLLFQINGKRFESKLPALKEDSDLLELSKLLALDVANSKTGKPTLDLEKTAKGLGIAYSQIAYLVIVQSQSSVQPFDQLLWTEENNPVLLTDMYQSLGIQSIETKDENQSIITVLSFSSPSKKSSNKPNSQNQSYYTGVELWNEIQKYRVGKGVPEFKQDNTLCTITSIRVNQLLKLNELDDHKGFGPLVDEYRDDGRLKFGNLGENILKGYPTAAKAVMAWDGSLGHKALMSDGSYVWACASANYGFAVLIAAY